MQNPEERENGHSESEESSEGRIFSPTRRGYIAPDISLRLTPWLHAREHPETFSTPQASQQILTREQLEAWAAFTHSRGRIQFSVRDSSSSHSRMADDNGENPTRGDTDDTGGSPAPSRGNSPPHFSSYTPRDG